MSMYTQCGEAARMLLDDPQFRLVTQHVPHIFTELDVIALAESMAHEAGADFDEDDKQEAIKQAPAALGALWRSRQIVRYGPVQLPGLYEPDYMRIQNKIAYGSPDGPKVFETPNGTFPRIMIHEDIASSGRQGRRLGTNRDDMTPWDEQKSVQETLERAALMQGADERETSRLRAELLAVQRRAEEAEAEISRLRNNHSEVLTRADIKFIVAEVVAAITKNGSNVRP